MKNRKVKEFEYYDKYSNIPVDFEERLSWIIDTYKVKQSKYDEIILKRNMMMCGMYYTDLKIILYELPEGAVRPKFRIVNRGNFANAAMANSQFVHVYSPNAKDDSIFMKRMTDTELSQIDEMTQQLLCTPCIVEYHAYHQTPKTYSTEELILSEIGAIRPIAKPDWDNIGKKYSDMSNHNIWLDDSFVIEGTVKRFFSILPRVEIYIKYLNVLYNRKQFDFVSNRKDFKENNCQVNYFKMEDIIQ